MCEKTYVGDDEIALSLFFLVCKLMTLPPPPYSSEHDFRELHMCLTMEVSYCANLKSMLPFPNKVYEDCILTGFIECLRLQFM